MVGSVWLGLVMCPAVAVAELQVLARNTSWQHEQINDWLANKHPIAGQLFFPSSGKTFANPEKPKILEFLETEAANDSYNYNNIVQSLVI